MSDGVSLEQIKKELFEVLAKTDSPKKMSELFDDLCTFKEIEQMAQRLHAAKLLSEGKTYAEVIEQTEISSATLSRVSRCLQYGKGYSAVFKRR